VVPRVAQRTLERRGPAEQPLQQFRASLIIRNHHVRSGRDQPLAFPAVHDTRFHVTGHGHGRAAHLPNFFRFHDAIAEAEQLLTAEVVLRQNAVNDAALRERRVVAFGGVDLAAEEGA
jgi:hypothetical protein